MKLTVMSGPAKNCTHAEYQKLIIDTATLLGWSHLHVRKSKGKADKWQTTTNLKGWPDLFLWHPRHGTAAIEVKVGYDKADDDQRAVLEQLNAAGVRAVVAYPADWELVVLMLSGIR